MVGLDCKSELASSDNMPARSPRPNSSSNKFKFSLPPPPAPVLDLSPASDATCNAYEHYLRLPEVKNLWNKEDFPGWKNEAIMKPALHALELTFRFISIVLSDPRPYTNRKEWTRRLESLTTSQLELISLFCEEDANTPAPLVTVSESKGILTREGSHAEVWKLNNTDENSTVFVSQVSEQSLLPRLAAWTKSQDVARTIQYSIECRMMRCPYTLGLGEPNLTGKPILHYDAVCSPSELHSVAKSPPPHADVSNLENQTLFTIHQILESWIHVAQKVINRIETEIESHNYEQATNNSYILEQIWKLFTEIEDLHLLTDPDDLLRLKNQLDIKTTSDTESLCFRSKSLIKISRSSKDLRHKVPYILGVEVDPLGGPVIQEAAIRLYRRKNSAVRIHLLQGLQAVESAVKRFYYAYKQMLVVVMGSVEAKGNLAFVKGGEGDALGRVFLEPTCFPSLDGAKTFLGDYWRHEGRDKVDGFKSNK